MPLIKTYYEIIVQSFMSAFVDINFLINISNIQGVIKKKTYSKINTSISNVFKESDLDALKTKLTTLQLPLEKIVQKVSSLVYFGDNADEELELALKKTAKKQREKQGLFSELILLYLKIQLIIILGNIDYLFVKSIILEFTQKKHSKIGELQTIIENKIKEYENIYSENMSNATVQNTLKFLNFINKNIQFIDAIIATYQDLKSQFILEDGTINYTKVAWKMSYIKKQCKKVLNNNQAAIIGLIEFIDTFESEQKPSEQENKDHISLETNKIPSPPQVTKLITELSDDINFSPENKNPMNPKQDSLLPPMAEDNLKPKIPNPEQKILLNIAKTLPNDTDLMPENKNPMNPKQDSLLPPMAEDNQNNKAKDDNSSYCSEDSFYSISQDSFYSIDSEYKLGQEFIYSELKQEEPPIINDLNLGSADNQPNQDNIADNVAKILASSRGWFSRFLDWIGYSQLKSCSVTESNLTYMIVNVPFFRSLGKDAYRVLENEYYVKKTGLLTKKYFITNKENQQALEALLKNKTKIERIPEDTKANKDSCINLSRFCATYLDKAKINFNSSNPDKLIEKTGTLADKKIKKNKPKFPISTRCYTRKTVKSKI